MKLNVTLVSLALFASFTLSAQTARVPVPLAIKSPAQGVVQHSKPITRTYLEDKQVCGTESRPSDTSDGAELRNVAKGLIGGMVGTSKAMAGGSGLAGGVGLARGLMGGMQPPAQQTVQVCRTEGVPVTGSAGFEVTFTFRGDTFVTETELQPGSRIDLVPGMLVVPYGNNR